MLQYLINATAIWLLSLAVFDTFLRRETYHGYNRAYLVFTMLAGITIPFFSWHPGATTGTSLIAVYTLKETIVTSKAASATISSQKSLMIVYGFGILVFVCLLCIDIIKLMRLYHAGKRSTSGEWTVIETGTSHAPFSFFGLLFVSAKESYSPEEWHMLATHEEQHKDLYHFADLLLIQLYRIVFWFHPLVHVYYRRLMLVHEYQADVKARESAAVYGRFLVEQAVLNAAPSITHSFNRSPIKKRIIMLTKTSSAIAKFKMALVLPVAAICFTCFSAASFAQEKTEKKDEVFKVVDVMPKAPYDLSAYLGENLHYPEIARQNKIEGKVIVKFVIDEHGRVTNPEVVRGIGGGCDEEALRVIKEMPVWTPGSQNGKLVKVYYHLPIMFRLS